MTFAEGYDDLPLEQHEGQHAVAAVYRFAPLFNIAEHRASLIALAEQNGVVGTLILASEGINGTIAGPSRAAVELVLAYIRGQPGFETLDVKWSEANSRPFLRLKVRLKRKIVTMGVPDIDPTAAAGTYVKPQDWNALISEPDVLVVDTRNAYEVAIGTFARAMNPGMRTFREFPEWARRNLDPAAPRRIAMFCTGGIRCEKATAYLRQQGFSEVYHLEGGILRYLEDVPPQDSLWRGECFVFDRRVSVGHELVVGSYKLCAGCRSPMPASVSLKEDGGGSEGASAPALQPPASTSEDGGGYADRLCAACESRLPGEKKRAAAERQRQIALARRRGHRHLGRKY
ncbi:MAG: rhodanese-related sulfurtransferase [Hyphomicrobiaceae bacterium]